MTIFFLPYYQLLTHNTHFITPVVHFIMTFLFNKIDIKLNTSKNVIIKIIEKVLIALVLHLDVHLLYQYHILRTSFASIIRKNSTTQYLYV